jgi:hypothetical protein
MVRILLLLLLAALLLPYVLTPLYRAGHPVSTLMVWRWLKGAPVARWSAPRTRSSAAITVSTGTRCVT